MQSGLPVSPMYSSQHTRKGSGKLYRSHAVAVSAVWTNFAVFRFAEAVMQSDAD
ncbi:hypothetical protein KIN20_000023 [Parelaphostrongylus tenuis]|uniref:Uncharacterized protein n=1 Tax=Parelaphostrongylus tenuis TaxID=148309 RepID=A0AAD5QB64_PARTN|nr:hypothetical protein KIN20_000023 [Parelaphostrongylus tenuis]